MDDFYRHAGLFVLTLGAVCGLAALHAPSDVVGPLATGLGVTLPVLLGLHVADRAVGTWKAPAMATATAQAAVVGAQIDAARTSIAPPPPPAAP